MLLEHLGHTAEAAKIVAAVESDLTTRDPKAPGSTAEIGERLAAAAAG
jgi:3-isopropylmalate dehydrogenase